MLRIVILLCCALTLAVRGFNPYPKRSEKRTSEDAGEPLLLSPYIDSGKIEEARKLAEVPAMLPGVTSYSGFITVDQACNANMFFWFFPAENNYETSPLSIWLQGGPGGSSLYGLFNENSPLLLTPEGTLQKRKFTWTHASSYLSIDNPVGTGFSFADSINCYSRNETHVGKNLLTVVKQFLKMFPELKSNPLFVTGESYAGKYVPALSYAIHEDNKVQQEKINLQGLAIGNGLVDPGNQLHYGDYLYQLGLIDSSERQKFQEEEELGRSYIAAGKWKEAFDVFDYLLNGDIIDYPSYFKNCTGFDFYFNYLYSSQPPEGDESAFVNKPEVREAIHVGSSVFHSGSDVELALMEDVMQSVAPWLAILLDNYRILIFNGQLDIIVAYPLTISYLQKLEWSAANEYRTAPRDKWYVGSELAGYVKKAGNLTEVLVRNAGHMVPQNQPRWALDLLSRFFANTELPHLPYGKRN